MHFSRPSVRSRWFRALCTLSDDGAIALRRGAKAGLITVAQVSAAGVGRGSIDAYLDGRVIRKMRSTTV